MPSGGKGRGFESLLAHAVPLPPPFAAARFLTSAAIRPLIFASFVDIAELRRTPIADLQDMANGLRIPNTSGLRKQELIFRIEQTLLAQDVALRAEGTLEVTPEGFGFLRSADYNYLAGPDDVYVSQTQIKRLNIRTGDTIRGRVRPAKTWEKYLALLQVESINGLPPEAILTRVTFDNLRPRYPDQRIRLEAPSGDLSMRVMDLIAPIGKGQRGLIVSPPKAGKTTVMKQIAQSIETNNPEVHLMVLLVDERPEEVTDMRRSVKGEVIASTFDRPADEHTHIAELCIERAKRLVEQKHDVVIILDGITRLARGIASGSILEFANREMLADALRGRQKF